MASKLNKSKVIAVAQKYVQKGQYDKAIREYQRIVEEDPRDVRIWLKIGDLQARKNDPSEAIATYSKVAEFYSEQGFYLKAVAVYKQILRLDSSLVEVNLRLAELYKQLGLLSDAMKQYEQVSNFYHQEGRIKEALAALRQIVELDPENVASRIKLAELYSRENMRDDAVEEFSKAADYLRAENRIDDFIKVAERLVFHQPDNLVVVKELSGIYLQRQDPRRSLQKLQLAFKADPRDEETLEMLAQAFQTLGQTNKTISVLKELARVFFDSGELAKYQEVHRRILRLNPEDPEAQEALRRPQAAPPPRPVEQPPLAHKAPLPEPVRTAPEPLPLTADDLASPLPEVSESPLYLQEGARPARHVVAPAEALGLDLDSGNPRGEPVSLAEEARAVRQGPAAGFRPQQGYEQAYTRAYIYEEEHVQAQVQAPSLVPGPELPDDLDEAVARTITEADVYMKYGLTDKAIEHLQQILEQAPANLELRLKLRDIYLETHQPQKASRELIFLAEQLVHSDQEMSLELLAEAVELDRDNRDAEALLQRLQGIADAASAGDAGQIPGDADGEMEPIDLDADDIMEELAVEPSGVVEMDQTLAGSIDGGSYAASGTGQEGHWEEVEIQDDEIYSHDTDERRFPDSGTTDQQTPMTAAVDQQDESYPTASRRKHMDTFEEHIEDVRPVRPSPEVRERPVPHEGGGGIEYDLEEAEFFIQQSLFGEARAILEELLQQYPDHPLIEAKLAELELTYEEHESRVRIRSTPGVELDRAELDTEPPADLAADLAEEVEVVEEEQDNETVAQSWSSSFSVEDIFKEFKRGVDDQVSEEDSDTHYDLGIAYREMGLMDDAINEFRVAMRAKDKEVLCHMMIGLCHMDKGAYSEAISQFKKGLYVETISPREVVALYFELGQAYEQLQDRREAIYYYEKVAKKDPRFRNVTALLDALGRLEGRQGAGAMEEREEEGTGPGGDNEVASKMV